MSYLICAFLPLMAAVLVYFQLQHPPSPDRDLGILSLALAVGMPALAVPLPFLLEHYKKRETGRWIYSGADGTLS